MIVYLLFLSVQVLFNIDIHPQPTNLSQSVITAKPSFQPGRKIWKFRLNKKAEESTVRLNKRFEPAGMPGFPNFDIHTPLVYTPLVKMGTGNAGYYQSAILHKHTLRGPPLLII